MSTGLLVEAHQFGVIGGPRRLDPPYGSRKRPAGGVGPDAAQYPMFFSACGPRRSASCARYRLGGLTGTPGESRMPSGRFGPRSNGRELSRLVPTEPISQLAAPGGF